MIGRLLLRVFGIDDRPEIAGRCPCCGQPIDHPIALHDLDPASLYGAAEEVALRRYLDGGSIEALERELDDARERIG
jgi:hypothetical protein